MGQHRGDRWTQAAKLLWSDGSATIQEARSSVDEDCQFGRACVAQHHPGFLCSVSDGCLCPLRRLLQACQCWTRWLGNPIYSAAGGRQSRAVASTGLFASAEDVAGRSTTTPQVATYSSPTGPCRRRSSPPPRDPQSWSGVGARLSCETRENVPGMIFLRRPLDGLTHGWPSRQRTIG